MNLFLKIGSKLSYIWNRRSGNAYIDYLRKKGVCIGRDCVSRGPLTQEIDITRPELVSIGDHVFLHKGLKIITHDWASWVFVGKYADFIPSHGKVSIGNNVWFGENVMVLKNVTIGDNCIIGAGSIVTRDIPSNSVAVGVPAKVISSLDTYYEKRRKQYPEELIEYANILRKTNANLNLKCFYDDYPLFVDKTNIDEYPDIPFLNVFGTKEKMDIWLKHHKAIYQNFNTFLDSLNGK